MIKDYVLIIGSMKSGTTSLFDHLSAHPKIAGAKPKEPGFFAFEHIFEKGFDWYENLFNFDATLHEWALEASTDYTKHPHATGVVERLLTSGRHVKLIYIMRNPLKRIESHARHVQRVQMELGREISHRNDHSLDSGVTGISMDISRYAMQIDQYKEYFDRGDLLLISLEELQKHEHETLSKVCAFLGIDPAGLPQSITAKNKADDVALSQRPHIVWRAASAFSPLRALVKVLVPQKMRKKLREEARPRLEIEGRFKLTEQEKKQYLKELHTDLIRLRDVYGFDVTAHWGIDL